MKKKSAKTVPAPGALRRRAESQLREQPARVPEIEKSANIERILQELEIHRIELEMQNEELRHAKLEVETGLEKYTDLFDFAPVGYFNLAQGGTIQMVNLTGATLVGIERSRLTGRSMEHLISAGQRPAFHAFLKKVFTGAAAQSADFMLTGDTHPPRTVNIEAQRLPHAGDCRAVVVDITARKQAEEAVLVSEVRYRRLFEAAQDGVLLVNPVTRKITDSNPFMTRLLGYRCHELAGRELYEIGLLKDEAASREMFRKLKKSHHVRYEDLPLKSKAGRLQQVEVVANLYEENGNSVIQCNIRDITARIRAGEIQRRLDVETASNEKLKLEIIRRTAVELALKKSEHRAQELLEETREAKKKLRRLGHENILLLENQRKQISRELHDKISQVLIGINVKLEVFTRRAALDPAGIPRAIAPVRKLVNDAVRIVHNFARRLRPAMLDDLGLIPALRAHIDGLPARQSRQILFTGFAGEESLDNDKRTVLYRVAQEALVNVAKHARARSVKVVLKKTRSAISLEIADDGKAFDVKRLSSGEWSNRLGLTGMRERVEMAGGKFTIESTRGKGTTIRAQVPSSDKRTGK